MSVPTLVTKEEAYHELDQSDVYHGQETEKVQKFELNQDARNVWIESFLQQNLPSRSFNDKSYKQFFFNVDQTYASVDCSLKRKKRGKSKASIKMSLPKKSRFSKILFDKDSEVKYESYVPLNKMWKMYIEELIQFPKKPNHGFYHNASLKMMKADFHGCHLTVKKSRCPSYVGLNGIVIQETRNMFILVSSSNIIKHIPKAHSQFTFMLHNFVFTIHGNQFLWLPGDRAAKRYKPKGNLLVL